MLKIRLKRSPLMWALLWVLMSCGIDTTSRSQVSRNAETQNQVCSASFLRAKSHIENECALLKSQAHSEESRQQWVSLAETAEVHCREFDRIYPYGSCQFNGQLHTVESVNRECEQVRAILNR